LLVVCVACETDGCTEPFVEPGDGAPGARSGAAALPGGGPGGAPAPPASSPKEVLERAQAALRTGDHAALLACIRQDTRDAWLADLVVELAVETTDAGTDPDLRRRRARADARAILAGRGARLATRPERLGPAELGRALLSPVRDRLALYADLLDFAASRRAPFDPVRAVTGAESPSATATPLLRLVERVREPARLEETDAGTPVVADGPFALFVTAKGAPIVLRFYAKDGAYWLDES
jgi:hypothetical protein